MALIYKDRVYETTTTTGTGALTLAGALAGYQAFSTVGNANTCYYECHAVDANGIPAGDWEVGLGTYATSGNALTRTTVLASSNSGSAVNFSAGTKRVSLTHPAAAIPNDTLTLQYGAQTLTLSVDNSGYGTLDPSGSYLTIDGFLHVNSAIEGSYIHAHNDACATTNSVTNVMQRTASSTGTPAAGFGLRDLDVLESSAGDVNAANREVYWANATFGAQKCRVVHNVYDTDARECIRMEASGSAPMVGFLGATAVIRQTLNAAASDPATTQALVNQIRQLLIDFGLAT